MNSGVSADQKIGENSSSGEIAMTPAAFSIAAKSFAGRSPYLFTQFPIHRNSRVFKEGVNEVLRSTWSSQQFCEDGGRHDEISTLQSGYECGTGSQLQTRVLAPQSDNDVGVDRGGHGQSL